MLCGQTGGCGTDSSLPFARALGDVHLGIQRAFGIPPGIGWVLLAVSPLRPHTSPCFYTLRSHHTGVSVAEPLEGWGRDLACVENLIQYWIHTYQARRCQEEMRRAGGGETGSLNCVGLPFFICEMNGVGQVLVKAFFELQVWRFCLRIADTKGLDAPLRGPALSPLCPGAAPDRLLNRHSGAHEP